MEKGAGSSGSTARGVIDHLKTHEPPWFVLENVADLVEPANSKNLAALIQEIRAAGYACKATILDAIDNGYPTRRPRAYFGGIHLDFTSSSFQAHAGTIV